MFELALGALLAVLFIAAYLLISKFMRGDGRELSGTPPSVSLNPMESDRAIGARRSPQALTAGDLKEHHAGSAKNKDTGREK